MQETTKRRNLLDTPLLSLIAVNWETILFVLILVAAVLMRFVGLSLRSLSHDGSIHASWSHDLYIGRGYRHNPTYHGPFLYHFTALLFFLFGDTDVTALSSPAIFGVILVALPWLLRKELGRIGALLASAMLAISPFVVAYSRILRHDMFLAVWGLLLIVAVFRYLRERTDRWLYLVAAATALTMTTKEVAFIEVFIIGSFLFFLLLSEFLPTLQEYLRGRSAIELIFLGWLLALWKILVTFWEYLRNGSRPRPRPASFDLVVVVGTLVVPMALAPLIVQALGALLAAMVGLVWGWRRWLISAGIFYAITLLLFTTFLTNSFYGAASGYVGSLGYWLSQQEVQRGGQPWFYYFIIMPLYEFMPLLLGGLGALSILLGAPVLETEGETTGEQARPRPANVNTIFVIFLLYWAVAILGFLTWAGEKMPWLMVHLTIPWLLLGAWFAGRVLASVDWRGWWQRGGVATLALVPLAVFGLVTLLRFHPFSGVTLADLNQTMRWIGALIILIIAAWGLWTVGRRLGRKAMGQSVFIVLVAALYLLTVRFSIMATHTNINYATEWIGYAHSTPDPVRVAREIEDLSRRYAGDLSMPVAYDDDSSWPFAWYLRNFTDATFYGKKPNKPFDQPVVLVGSANEQEVKPYLGDNYYRFDERLIWWPLEVYKDFTWENLKRKLPLEEQPPPPAEGEKEKVPIVTYLRLLVTDIREQRRDPAKRQTLWNVIWHRKFKENTNSWPLVHRFALYVRKDVANQLWDFSVGPAAPETLPQDPYADLYSTLAAIETWGAQGVGDGQFTNPRGVAVDPAGFVYVADSGNHRIQKFDPAGNHLLTWGSQGKAPGQFQEPWGLTVDEQGRVYVADTWNHRVQVFDSDGTFLRQWGTHAQVQDLAPDTAKLFWGPRDVAIDDQGRVLVTDTGNKRVQVFTSDGEFLTMFGGLGIEPGQMNEPVGVAVASDGRIYVADTWNRRVQVFDADFDFVSAWEIDGWWGESVVNKPYLTVDEEGRVYVTDPESYRVLVFTADGQSLTVFGQIGADASSFNLPTGIAVDEEGYVYVADAENHRIVKFAPLSQSID
jgi:uncharacterized protein (TIGR03663 family)